MARKSHPSFRESALITAFTNEKGGVGKTTSVLEVAYAAGKSGKTVLVVDLDPQGNATRMLLGVKGQLNIEPSVFDLFKDKDPSVALHQVIRSAVDDWPNVLVMPASSRMATIEGHLVQRSGKDSILRRILAPIKGKIDLILIDLKPAADFLALNALVAADNYVIPVDLSEYSSDGMQTIHELAKDVIDAEVNPNLKFLGAFFTSYHKGGSKSVRALEKDLKENIASKLTDVKVPHSVKVLESQQARKPVGLMSPDCSVAVAYKSLSDQILKANKAVKNGK